MARDCKKILDITNHTTNWLAKIKVNEKSNARWSRDGAKRYQNLIFSDSEVNRPSYVYLLFLHDFIYISCISSVNHISMLKD